VKSTCAPHYGLRCRRGWVWSTGRLRMRPGPSCALVLGIPGDEPGPIADPPLEIACDGRILGAPKR
jgi:hypothetical protein